MKQNNRTNMLLVELMIVILFFALSLSVLIRMLSGARKLSDMAGAETRALSEAQNVAEELKAAIDPEEYLLTNGFLLTSGAYEREADGYTVSVVSDTFQETEAGVLAEYEVAALYKGETLFTLAVSRYAEVTP